MPVSFQVTPLYGARTASPCPRCTLVSLDGLNILLDVGGTTTAPPPEALTPHLPTIHLVLLTHPSLPHTGSLPSSLAHLPATTPVFSTLPTWRLSHMALYTAHQSATALAPFPNYDLDAVDASLDAHSAPPRVRLLRYREHTALDTLHPRAAGVTLTAYPAGHSLGGALWLLRKGAHAAVLSSALHHRRELHLAPCALAAEPGSPVPQELARPAWLVLGAVDARKTTRSVRAAHLVAPVAEAVKRGGDVLVVVGAAARVVEVAADLHGALPGGGVKGGVVVVGEFCERTFAFARTMLEWTSERVVRRFDNTRENALELRGVKFVRGVEDIAEGAGRVVVAGEADLESGPARDVFVRWAARKECLVVMADRPAEGTLGEKVMGKCVDGQVDRYEDVKRKVEAREEWEVALVQRRRAPLEGDALAKWREERRAEREGREREKAREKEARDEEARKREEERVRGIREMERARVEAEKSSETEREKEREKEQAKEKEESSDGSSSSSEDDDDDADYDAAMVMGLSKGGGGVRLMGSSASRPSAPPLGIGGAAGVVGKVAEEPGSRPLPVGVPQEEAPVVGPAVSGGNWDDYGQAIGIKRFAIGEDPSANLRGGTGEKDEGGDEDVHEEEEEVPLVYSESRVDVVVRCSLIQVDRAGLSEGDALKRMVKELEPRRVVLVAGGEEETEHFREYLASALSPAKLRDATGAAGASVRFDALASGGHVRKRRRVGEEERVVLAPKNGETADVSTEVPAGEITIDESVQKGLRWKNVGQAAIAYVDGVLNVPEGGAGMMGEVHEEKVEPSPKGKLVGRLESTVAVVPAAIAGRFPTGGVLVAPAGCGSDGGEDAADADGVPVEETAGGTGADPLDAPVVPADGCREFLAPPVRHPTVYVGTIMLGKLKDALLKAGIHAELAEGVLCVQSVDTGGVVLVKKVGLQNLVVEGALCEEYYAVRDVLYDELVVVSAS